VTNLEFKEAIRKLMTGLTSREIDELLNSTPMDSDNRISYKDFIKKMMET
jgi:Ca2+-binding EF-hand superfamily protein